MTRLAILGDGRMGTLLAEMAPAAGLEVVAHLGAKDTASGLGRALLGNADVVIEFTVPAAAAGLITQCAALGVPVVSGTTGWDAQRDDVERQVRDSKGALLWAPNFSLGVHLFTRIVADAARRFALPAAAFEGHLVETHHMKKLDAPSGTARLLAARAKEASGREMPITSVRVGSVPGTHEVIFDAAFEQVRLVHEARDRRVFAAGALTAARWLVGKRGVFTLDDLLGEGGR